MNTTADFDQELSRFEQACAGFDPTRLSESAARTELERRWQDGIGLLTGLDRAGDLPDELPRLRAAMTVLATAWLTPRPHAEPRALLYERIAALQPIKPNKRLQELAEKNKEGTIRIAEYAELVRLKDSFDALQAIISEAISSTQQLLAFELDQYERTCAGFDPLRLSEAVARSELERYWRDGAALLIETTSAESATQELPRLLAAMTVLATAWLRPRFAGETHDRIVERIAALKVPELNDRLAELRPKNTEGTLTAGERAEFERLHDRLDFLQDALSAAIHAVPPVGS